MEHHEDSNAAEEEAMRPPGGPQHQQDLGGEGDVDVDVDVDRVPTDRSHKSGTNSGMHDNNVAEPPLDGPSIHERSGGVIDNNIEGDSSTLAGRYSAPASSAVSGAGDNDGEGESESSPGLDISTEDISLVQNLTRPPLTTAAAASVVPPPSSPTDDNIPRNNNSSSMHNDSHHTSSSSPRASPSVDAPATAAADQAATLPVPSLNVDAIDGLIANADNNGTANAFEAAVGFEAAAAAVTSSSSPAADVPSRQEPQSGAFGQQQQRQSMRQQASVPAPPQQPPNAAAIVRSIASYLSLSDAESIGSLACTPYTIAGGTAATPYSTYSSTASRRSRYAGGRTPGSYCSGGGSRRAAGGRRPPSSLLLDHSNNNDDDAVSAVDHDDADAAAGGIMCSSAGRTPAGILMRSRTGSTGNGSVSWAGGDGLTPSAPGLVSLGEEEGGEGWDEGEEEKKEQREREQEGIIEGVHGNEAVETPFDEESMRVFRRRQRKLIQQKLTAAVMSHPNSIRSYCLEAQRAAAEMKQQRIKQQEEHMVQFGEEEGAMTRKQQLEQRQRVRILRAVLNGVLSNVPLSVLLDLAESAFETSLDTTVAVFKVTAVTVDGAVSILASAVGWSFGVVSTLNPFVVVGTILTIQRDAAYHATDALVTGIQSVATGVGSAGTAATFLTHLSRAGGGHASAGGEGLLSGGGIAGKRVGSGIGIAEQTQFGSASRFLSRINLLRGSGASNTNNNMLSEKLYRKLSRVDSSSRVLSYIEREDEVISQHARKRVQRMMHYHVSLRPFVATVSAPKGKNGQMSPLASFQNVDFQSSLQTPSPSRQNSNEQMETNSISSEDDSEPFMCTPKSFPPTPTSRSNVMARGFRFSEDVVFLARDQLRLQGSLDSDNPQTRALARALKEGNRLAVFNASEEVGSGVLLTCGQHVATKKSNDLYCSTRSMVPVLRNCYVYFEMSVSTQPTNTMMLQHASVSVGLSTLEMPLNALVGAWKGSVGLCTTGQILAAGQWCSPLDPRLSAYGNNSTVGCLVCLDDDSAFETWDGTMVTAVVTFNVNGQVVNPPVCSMPMAPQTQNQYLAGVNNDSLAATGSNDSEQQQLKSPPSNSSTMPLYVPREEELYATLTLHSPDTQVMCRFCAEDLLAKSRKEIGAPEGVTIYAVDGSVLLSDDMNELPPYLSSDENESGSMDSLSDLQDPPFI